VLIIQGVRLRECLADKEERRCMKAAKLCKKCSGLAREGHSVESLQNRGVSEIAIENSRRLLVQVISQRKSQGCRVNIRSQRI